MGVVQPPLYPGGNGLWGPNLNPALDPLREITQDASPFTAAPPASLVKTQPAGPFRVTCRYPGTDPSPGSSLKVLVLTAATEAGGAQNIFAATGAPSWSVTPNGNRSLPAFAV